MGRLAGKSFLMELVAKQTMVASVTIVVLPVVFARQLFHLGKHARRIVTAVLLTRMSAVRSREASADIVGAQVVYISTDAISEFASIVITVSPCRTTTLVHLATPMKSAPVDFASMGPAKTKFPMERAASPMRNA